MTFNLSAVLRMVPAVTIMGTIFFLSHQPGDALPLYPLPGIDKIAHLVVYGLLAVSVLFGFACSYRLARPYKVILITVIVCLFYGFLDEYHQSFIPNRFVSGLDVVADFTGAILVCGVWNWWRISKNR